MRDLRLSDYLVRYKRFLLTTFIREDIQEKCYTDTSMNSRTTPDKVDGKLDPFTVKGTGHVMTHSLHALKVTMKFFDGT